MIRKLTQLEHHKKLQALSIKAYIEGKCFLCGAPCLPGHYLHWECAITYSDEKENKHKQIDEEYEAM